MTVPLRVAIAAVSGLAVTVGFPPYDLAPVLLAGLVGFLFALRGATPRAGAVVGFAFGVVFVATLTPWLRVIGTDVWLGLALAEGLFLALFGWAFALVGRWRWWPLAAVCLWVGVEYLRATVPFSGFPWGRLAFAMTDAPLAGYARWLGVPALSAIVFGLACLLVLAWEHRRSLRSIAVSVAAAGVVVAGALVLPVGLAEPAGSLTVAAIQGDVPGTGADGFGQQQEVLRNHVTLTREYADQADAGAVPKADLVIWPENASDIDPLSTPSEGELIASAVREAGVPTLVGTILDGPRSGTALNVSIVWDPQTGPGEQYVKRNLVPFGEYIPFRSVLSRYISRLDQIPRDMLPGQEPGVLTTGPAVVGTMICFDVAYDTVARDVATGGAELLVVQTNNATYLGTSQPEQQWAISRLRAIETGKDLVVASTNGISGVVRADGSVASRSESGQPDLVVDTVALGTGVTLGVRIGGWLELAMSAIAGVLLAAALVARRRGRRPAAPRPETVTGSRPPSDRALAGRAAR